MIGPLSQPHPRMPVAPARPLTIRTRAEHLS